jgi:hypothetical protein
LVLEGGLDLLFLEVVLEAEALVEVFEVGGAVDQAILFACDH